MSAAGHVLYLLSGLVLDPEERTLTLEGRRLLMRPQAFDLLVYLAERGGEVVTREELEVFLWGEDAVVGEELVRRLVLELRRALEGCFDVRIETVRGEGYRLDAEVSRVRQGRQESSLHLEAEPAPTPVAGDWGSAATAVPPRLRPVRVGPAMGVGAVVALVLALAVAVLVRSSGGSREPGARPARRSVAVPPFDVAKVDDRNQWVAQAVAETLNADLLAGGELLVVAGERIGELERDLPGWRSDPGGTTAIQQAGRYLGADLLVLGSAAGRGDDAIDLEVRLYEAASGSRLAATAASTVAEGSAALGRTLSAWVLRRIGVPSVQAARAAWTLPAEPGAARTLVEGAAALRLGDLLRGIPAIEGALAADPRNGPGHLALAVAFDRLDDRRRAGRAAELALGCTLTVREREHARLLLARARGLAEDAIAAAQRRWRLDRDDLDAALALLDTQLRFDRVAEAMGTLEALGAIPGARPGDPNLVLARAECLMAADRFAEALAAARAARAVAGGTGARGAQARALLVEARSARAAGDRTAALAAARRAARELAAMGDRARAARALEVEGTVLRQEGDLAGARRSYARCAEVARAGGAPRAEASCLQRIGRLDLEANRTLDAAAALGEAARLHALQGDDRAAAGESADCAIALLLRGDFAGVRLRAYEGLRCAERIDDPLLRANLQGTLGMALVLRGELGDGIRRCEQAAAAYEQLGEPLRRTWALAVLAEAQTAAGELAGARRTAAVLSAVAAATADAWASGTAALVQGRLAQCAGELGDAAAHLERAAAALDETASMQASLLLAQVRADGGELAAVETVLRGLAEGFARGGEPDLVAVASAERARVLELQGRRSEALAAASGALAAIEGRQNRLARLAVEATVGWVEGRAGRGGHEGVERLRASILEARALGALNQELEGSLLLGELELASSGRRDLLEAVEERARAAGFGLIARKASALITTPAHK